jgi:hypothetical protein
MAKKGTLKKPSDIGSSRFHIKEVAEPKINHDLSKPIFSFHYMQYGGDCCISRAEKDAKVSIVDTMLRISQLTWQSMFSVSKGSLGHEKIPQWRFKTKLQLPPGITPEVPAIVFRYSESGRIAGFRAKDIFHIIAVGQSLYSH